MDVQLHSTLKQFDISLLEFLNYLTTSYSNPIEVSEDVMYEVYKCALVQFSKKYEEEFKITLVEDWDKYVIATETGINFCKPFKELDNVAQPTTEELYQVHSYWNDFEGVYR